MSKAGKLTDKLLPSASIRPPMHPCVASDRRHCCLSRVSNKIYSRDRSFDSSHVCTYLSLRHQSFSLPEHMTKNMPCNPYNSPPQDQKEETLKNWLFRLGISVWINNLAGKQSHIPTFGTHCLVSSVHMAPRLNSSAKHGSTIVVRSLVRLATSLYLAQVFG